MSERFNIRDALNELSRGATPGPGSDPRDENDDSGDWSVRQIAAAAGEFGLDGPSASLMSAEYVHAVAMLPQPNRKVRCFHVRGTAVCARLTRFVVLVPGQTIGDWAYIPACTEHLSGALVYGEGMIADLRSIYKAVQSEGGLALIAEELRQMGYLVTEPDRTEPDRTGNGE